ncbi:hypothetical protein B9N43_00540 [Denitratisoma sp. DHT3]|nr:hypothetical protein B9N43_00540 [Denitratisoma sp. DHT3]
MVEEVSFSCVGVSLAFEETTIENHPQQFRQSTGHLPEGIALNERGQQGLRMKVKRSEIIAVSQGQWARADSAQRQRSQKLSIYPDIADQAGIGYTAIGFAQRQEIAQAPYQGIACGDLCGIGETLVEKVLLEIGRNVWMQKAGFRRFSERRLIEGDGLPVEEHTHQGGKAASQTVTGESDIGIKIGCPDG